MSRFKRIKNKSTKKSSVSIDEKIASLNQELEKTGMLSEKMTTSNVYSISQHIPATDDVISPVPDGSGLVDGTWTQPVGTAFGGGTAGTFPTTFPKIWNNAGYRTPVSGILNTDNLNGDGAALQIAKMPDNGEPFETEVSQAARDAGAVGGFMKYNSGINAGWRSGYITGGTRDSGGGTFNAYDGQTFGGKYGITHLGVSVNPTSHPHLFRPVQYWHPFSIFNPDIDAYWPGGDQTPKYGGVVAEINGVKYALFTAYKWIGDGGNTYISQHARPASSILIQRRGIGDINYHGPITPGGMFGLSDQGYNYLSGRAKRRTLRGGTIYRKEGSGRGITTGRGGTRTKRGAKLIPIDRGGKVSSRGVGNYIRERGAGFSPSAGRVAKTVAKELPPKPTPAEIRKATVDEFRKNGDNLGANRFYTEDRISELQSKPNLTYSEQKELDQLKVNAVYMNQVAPPPEQVMAQAQEAKNEIYSGNSSIKPDTTLANSVSSEEATNNMAEALKNTFDSYANSEAASNLALNLLNPAVAAGLQVADALSTPYETIDYYAENADKAAKALNDALDKFVPDATQKQINSFIGKLFDGAVDNFIEPFVGDKKVASNLLQTYDEFINGELPEGPVDISSKFSKSDMDAFRNVVDNNTKKLIEIWRNENDPEKKENYKKMIENSVNSELKNLSSNLKPGSFGNTFGPGGSSVDIDALLNDNKLRINDNYAFRHDPDIATKKLPNAITQILGVSNDTMPMDSNFLTSILTPLAARLLLRPPDDGTNRSWTENIEDAPAMPFFAELDLNSDENPGFDPKGELPDFIQKGGAAGAINRGIKGLFDKVKDLFNKDKGAKSNADKYPPPKQESIFTNEDGSKIKYYTRSIFTGKDGKTYKSVLSLPFIESKDGGEGRFATLYHPGAYEFNIPLFDTPMDEPLGDYTPPDDLPDIPFTPPEEPDNKKDYEKNRDKQRKFRFNNSYKSKGDVLSEEAKLGHFEPEELYVDIEKLRKGIMPEFPKKSPKIIDGYHQDSKIKPKEPSKDVYLKLDPKDLIRNHRLKQKEADEMMKTIDMINAHIEEHPEDLIHAQQRYPVDDPRLAELNWKMDQMLDAGKEYMDSNFKENQTLYKRATDRTKKNIKLTDPEYVQQHYDELRGTIKPKKTKLVGRLGKHLNKYESKSLFKHVNSKNFKKINERKIERKEQVKQIQNEIEIEFQEKKNDWRKDLGNNTY